MPTNGFSMTMPAILWPAFKSSDRIRVAPFFEATAAKDSGSYQAEMKEIATTNFSLASAPELFLSSKIRT